MPCATITINDTGEIPGEEEPPEPMDTNYYLMLAGAVLIIILIFKK